MVNASKLEKRELKKTKIACFALCQGQ